MDSAQSFMHKCASVVNFCFLLFYINIKAMGEGQQIIVVL